MTQVNWADIPILDTKALEQTGSFLTPDAIASYLRTITERSDALLRRLHDPEAVPYREGGIVEATHTLAGSAGLLGFKRLAAVGRQFEHAVQSDTADVPGLAEELSATIEATIQAIRERTDTI